MFLSKTHLALCLHIHLKTLTKLLESGEAHYNFVFSLSLLEEAENSQPLSLDEMIQLFSDAYKTGRALKYSSNRGAIWPFGTKVLPSQVIVQATNIIDPSKTFTLNSVRKMADHFNCDRSVVQSRLDNGKVFKGEWLPAPR